MASRVSHELRNPLAAITNALYLLRNDLGAPISPEVESRLALIERETAKAADISEDMVAFARPRSPVPTPVELGLAVRRGARGRARPTGGPGGGVRRRRARARRPRPAGGDADEPGDQRLRRHARRAGSCASGPPSSAAACVITVEDSGTGVAHTVSSRVFEPFVTTKSHGTGLGLAIVQRIVESHDGSVAMQLGARPGTTRDRRRFPGPEGAACSSSTTRPGRGRDRRDAAPRRVPRHRGRGRRRRGSICCPGRPPTPSCSTWACPGATGSAALAETRRRATGGRRDGRARSRRTALQRRLRRRRGPLAQAGAGARPAARRGPCDALGLAGGRYRRYSSHG